MSDTNSRSPLLPASSETWTGSDGQGQHSATVTSTPGSSQSPSAATATAVPRPLQQARAAMTAPSAPSSPVVRKAETTMSWGAPLGLPIRSDKDENLVIFRRALGINTHQQCQQPDDDDDHNKRGRRLEEGRRGAVGMYRAVIETQTRMAVQHGLLSAFLYVVYFVQIVIGAALTAIGASSSASTSSRFEAEHIITVLAAVNTVLAGVLALVRGSGQPQKLGKDRVGYRRLQDWIEQTETLIAVGASGRNRQDVGLLVESAFKRYNAAKASEENNDPDFYVFHPPDAVGNRGHERRGSNGHAQ